MLHFKFKRNTKMYLLRDFVPCFIVVGLSWINFWINYRSTPARTLLSIASVLAITTMSSVILNSSGSSQGLRSIDFYVMMCQFFVVAGLIESIVVGMTAPNAKPVDRMQQMMEVLQNDDDDDNEEENSVIKISMMERVVNFFHSQPKLSWL